MFRWEKSPGVIRKPDCVVDYLDNRAAASTHDYAPGQILAFVVCSAQLLNQPDDIYTVVNTCKFVHKKGSVFRTIWQQDYTNLEKQSPSLVLVNVDSIVRHCLMFPIDPKLSCYQEIWSRERWADEFYVC